jgi:hypothetical protein
VLGYFSTAPAYQYLPPDKALLKLAFSHAAERRVPCRKLSPAEIAELAPNMRKPEACERERLPLLVELEMDGELIYRAEERPTGLWKDGASTVYRKFVVAPGKHFVLARLRDSRDAVGFDYEQSAEVDLAPQQNFVIGFRKTTGGFTFQ